MSFSYDSMHFINLNCHCLCCLNPIVGDVHEKIIEIYDNFASGQIRGLRLTQKFHKSRE